LEIFDIQSDTTSLIRKPAEYITIISALSLTGQRIPAVSGRKAKSAISFSHKKAGSFTGVFRFFKREHGLSWRFLKRIIQR
jgi:3-phenylpropionate/cinnamic acid dioxygenase small subunit